MDYINNGGLLEMLNLRNKRGYVESLLAAILQKDIQKRFGIRNAEALRLIANHLINNSCMEINYDEMSKQFGLSDKTIQRYVAHLQQAFLVQLAAKHSFKSKIRLMGCKSYIVDPGRQNNRENAMAAENIGWRLENVVYLELVRRYASRFLDVYYYRPGAVDKEVDFVVCNKNKAEMLIQVAYDISTHKTFKRETSALISASKTWVATIYCLSPLLSRMMWWWAAGRYTYGRLLIGYFRRLQIRQEAGRQGRPASLVYDCEGD